MKLTKTMWLLGFAALLAGSMPACSDDCCDCDYDGGSDSGVVAEAELYPVGGTVAGLDEGEFIVLSINGGETLVVAGDGAFQFGTELEADEDYAVTTTVSPEGRDCVLTGDTGTAGPDAADAVSVICDGFVVGGAVSGLDTGDFLVLMNNGDDPIIVTADGDFVFEVPLADGDSYDVTAQISSTLNECSVTGGSGVIGGTDVDTVAVVCAIPTHTVGGTVSGLGTGESVVLQLNGGDDLTVIADGAFTFTGAVALEESYAVTVLEHSAPGRECEVILGEGVVEGTVDDVEVDCGLSWSLPAILEDHINPTGFVRVAVTAPHRSVAMDDLGNAIVVWVQKNGNGYALMRSEYRDGVWVHPAGLADAVDQAYLTSTNAARPKVAMSNSGEAVLVWQQNDDTGVQRIYLTEYRGGVWSAPTPVSLSSTSASQPDVAMDDTGRAVVVWMQDSNLYRGDYGLTTSGAWTFPTDSTEAVSPDTTVYNPAVDMDSTGNAVIVWSVGSTQIMKSDYNLTTAGAWTDPATGETLGDVGTSTGYPQVAVRNGAALVAWADSYHIYRADYGLTSAATWTASTTGNYIDQGTTSSQTYPQVALDASGNATIAWMQYASSAFVFKSERRGGVWTDPADGDDHISLPAAGRQFNDPIHLAMNDLGEVIIAWSQYDSSDDINQVFISERRNDVWTHPADLSDYISVVGSDDDTQNPLVAMDNNGHALVTWNENGWDIHDVGNQNNLYIANYR